MRTHRLSSAISTVLIVSACGLGHSAAAATATDQPTRGDSASIELVAQQHLISYAKTADTLVLANQSGGSMMGSLIPWDTTRAPGTLVLNFACINGGQAVVWFSKIGHVSVRCNGAPLHTKWRHVDVTRQTVRVKSPPGGRWSLRVALHN